MSLTLGFQSAISGLLTAQRGIDVISRNIANVNTEGYNRKILSPESKVLGGYGAGVQVGDVTRIIDEKLMKSLRLETGRTAHQETATSYYTRLQDLFGTPADNTSISHLVADFSTVIETLAQYPDKPLNQAMAVRSANDLALRLNYLSEEVQSLRLQADAEIASAVEDVNNQLDRIDDLNAQIMGAMARGADSTELMDQRDLSLNTLSEYMDINYYTRADGSVTIYSGSGLLLLSDEPQHLSHVPTTDGDASMEMYSVTVAGASRTLEFGSGKMAAMMEMRDKLLPGLHSSLDEMSSQLKETMNQIHNRGAGYPSLIQTMEGSRTFIDSANQTIRMSGGDVSIALFDSSGNAAFRTSLNTLMEGAGGALNGPWTIDAVASAIEGWLQDPAGPNLAGATAAIDPATGKFDIRLNDTTYGLAFRDQHTDVHDGAAFASSTAAVAGANDTLTFTDDTGVLGAVAITAGDSLQTIAGKINAAAIGVTASVIQVDGSYRLRVANDGGRDMLVADGGAGLKTTLGLLPSGSAAAADVTIDFNVDGDAGPTYEETRNGFSYFFGLNDMFTAADARDIHQSKVVADTWRVPSNSTIEIRDSSGLMAAVNLSAGWTLDQVASAVDAAFPGGEVAASTVYDGGGYRLRLRHKAGGEMAISQTAGDLVGNLSLAPAAVRTAEKLAVRGDILQSPELLSRGAMQFDANKGKFYLSPGDASVAKDYAKLLADPTSFRRAGDVFDVTVTFAEYAATIISTSSSRAAAAESKLSYHQALKGTLEDKIRSDGGVNLDEELSQLMVYQQAYAASARVITASKELFDVLNSIIRS